MSIPQKRSRSDTMEQPSSSPFIPMFETFRAELDEHHDRRERVIKASRDVTAASKKIIFSLQRARSLGTPLHASITKANQQYWTTIRTQYSTISPDLQDIRTHRYARNISGGNQEFIESLSFQHYLETQTLISYEEARKRLEQLGDKGGPIDLSYEDYVLGIFDMVGEIMRFAITTMATNGKMMTGSKHSEDQMDVDAPQRTVLQDLQALRVHLETFEVPSGGTFGRDIEKKMGVMRECVEKVEKAFYGLIVRGRERPKGWMPDLSSSNRGFGEEVAQHS